MCRHSNVTVSKKERNPNQLYVIVVGNHVNDQNGSNGSETDRTDQGKHILNEEI